MKKTTIKKLKAAKWCDKDGYAVKILDIQSYGGDTLVVYAYEDEDLNMPMQAELFGDLTLMRHTSKMESLRKMLASVEELRDKVSDYNNTMWKFVSKLEEAVKTT